MPISAAARQAMYSQHTTEQIVTLIEFSNPDGADVSPWPFRICDHLPGVTSNGDAYEGAHFYIVPPDQSDEGTPTMKLGISGPSDEVIRELSTIRNPPTFGVQMILLSEPDTVLREWDAIKLKEIDADALGIRFSLRYEELSDEVYPQLRYSFVDFPGGF